MLLEQEETFGPMVAISRYADIGAAVLRANASTYGLGAVVFGGKEAEAVADQLEAGMIGINQGVGGSGDAPWVGAKQISRECSCRGMKLQTCIPWKQEGLIHCLAMGKRESQAALSD